MAHYAKISNGVVQQAIVADASVVALFPDASSWVVTSYNTVNGVHVDPITRLPDGGTPIGKNYAGAGMLWAGTGFCAPQPFPSWELDTATYQWKSPVAMPSAGGPYQWDEPSLSWK